MSVLGPRDRLLMVLLGLEGKSVEEVAAQTTANTLRLYGIAEG